MRRFLLALLLTLTPLAAHAASSIAASWPTNSYALTDGATISPLCPGSVDANGVGVGGFYTLTVTGNNHTIVLPSCSLASGFLFRFTQGPGGPYTGLTFSGALTCPAAACYVPTPIAGAIDDVGGEVVNSASWDFFSPQYNMLAPTTFAFVNSASCGAASLCTTGAVSMAGANLIVRSDTYSSGASLTAQTDSSSNTYTTALTITDTGGTGHITRCSYVYAPTVTAAMTFSDNFSSGGGATAISVAGFSGSAASPLDQSTSATSGASTVTSQQPSSITPTQNNELVVSCLGLTSFGGTASSGTAINGGFTLTGSVSFTPNVSWGGALGYLVQTNPLAANPTWNWATAMYANAGIMSFK